MTPRTALNTALHEAQARFRYIADPTTLDTWDTVAEFEARGGGDCDGWTLWCLHRASLLAHAPGCWWLLLGLVYPYGPKDGHAWAGLELDGVWLWADPTWGQTCDTPDWWTDRRLTKRYRVEHEILSEPIDVIS